MLRNIAIILAGGLGNRMQLETPKAFVKIGGYYLMEYSIKIFQECKSIDEIILVVPNEYQTLSEELIQPKYNKVSKIRTGGKTRFESSNIGVYLVDEKEAKVLIHDAARPFITEDIILNSLSALEQFDAINLLSPISDTVVELRNKQIFRMLDRDLIRASQTPQSFKLSTIRLAHEMAKNTPADKITDDFGLVLKYKCGTQSWIEGDKLNFKITYPQDLIIAEKLLKGSFNSTF